MLKCLLVILLIFSSVYGCNAPDPKIGEVKIKDGIWQERIERQLKFDDSYDIFLQWLRNEFGIEPLLLEYKPNKLPTFIQLESIDSDANCQYLIHTTLKLNDERRINSAGTSITRVCSYSSIELTGLSSHTEKQK
ncbi:hypothetical protein [Shewanella baltica]|uniref:hypothetical protein n=1 Tax=Shewanella baltica TaxID=62322 RepID=UPI000E026606|nr:hypothetical protein [Shewanella baltica]MCS6177841.1 hypothetical protein [Shewanella baltica]MCS6253987.1 hypothetical protein [Shewanella baltica]SUI80788.1 Uncharacterised protein [Shewanella baltica]